MAGKFVSLGLERHGSGPKVDALRANRPLALVTKWTMCVQTVHSVKVNVLHAHRSLSLKAEWTVCVQNVHFRGVDAVRAERPLSLVT